ncbi:unnamed protein product [Calypogeia fissa]
MEDSVEERHDSVIGAVGLGIFNPTVDGEEDLGRIVGPLTKWRFTHNQGRKTRRTCKATSRTYWFNQTKERRGPS